MRVFVAGPYTQPCLLSNTRKAIQAAAALRKRGHHPFLPHTALLWDFLEPSDYETWMEWTLSWLEVCDAVLRLPGESPGADREVARAEELGIPVYEDVRKIPRQAKREHDWRRARRAIDPLLESDTAAGQFARGLRERIFHGDRTDALYQECISFEGTKT